MRPAVCGRPVLQDGGEKKCGVCFSVLVRFGRRYMLTDSDIPGILMTATATVLLIFLSSSFADASSEIGIRRGPLFTYNPPGRLEFSNSTGAVIRCSATGTPTPSVRWVLAIDGSPATDAPGLRHQRPDGSLVFPPFRAEQYRTEVHSIAYRCLASNAMGTIASREVRIHAVVHRSYVLEVYDEFASSGSTAVIRCHVPTEAEDYLTLTGWKEEPTETLIQPSASIGGRYVTFPWGTLHIRNVDSSFSYRTYKCQTRNRLTGDQLESSSTGRLVVTESRSSSRPRITDSRPQIKAQVGSTVALPCVAQGYPLPVYTWRREQGDSSVELTQHRFSQLEGTLIIREVTVRDAGHYECYANNTVGSDRVHTQLLVTEPLAVSIFPEVQRAHIGRSWAVNCSVTGYPVHGIQWWKEAALLDTAEGRRQISTTTLLIDPVQREDKGMYQCFAYNDYDSAEAAVELQLGDDVPELMENFEEKTLQTGDSISLKCAAGGNPLPQVSWLLDGDPIPEDNHRVRSGDYVTSAGIVVSFVNVSRLKTEDGGLYKCVADNGVGQVYHEALVNVAGPPVPVRRRTGSNVTVVAGEVLVLRCPVAGYPLDHIHWERAGIRLPYNHRQKSHDNGTLEVHHVERSTDQGPYTCVATNRKGQSAQSTVFVRVQVKPLIEPFTFPKSLREDQRATAVCTVSSGDLPIRIKWFKDGTALPPDIRSSEVADYSSTLLFESLALRHKGNYTCEATNEAGSTSHTATMVIHVPPRWVIEPIDVFVVRGKSLTVDCQTEGFPQPRVRWRKSEGNSPKDFKPIVSSSHLQVFENGSLALADAREKDAGYYLCQATNGIGQGLSKVVRIKVQVAAHFRSKFTAEMVRKSHNTRLKCEALGDKPITIAWTKDKIAIKTQTSPRYELVETESREGVVSEIIIREAERRDSALYSCIASNAYGRDDTNIQLIVQEAPSAPQELRVVEAGSRSVKVAWNAPAYNGNSPITQYTVQYKDGDSGKWHNRMNNITLPGTETQGTVGGLKPFKLYLFRAIAENRIGRSDPTKPVEAVTDEEAPGAAPVKVRSHPLSAQSIKVTWKAPPEEHQYGVLRGYYVGYKATRSSDSYIYKTLEVASKSEETNSGGKEECHITGLRRNTQYSVLVQAFNGKGAGPPSDEVTVRTLEHDPPATPPLSVVDSSTSSIRLAWDTNYDRRNPVTGYILQGRPFESEDGEEVVWQEETHVSGNEGWFEVRGLHCGKRYQFLLTAFNNAGKGQSSEILTTKTQGTAPVAPDKRLLLNTNATTASIDLLSWENGGCPIQQYLVRYKQQKDEEWAVVIDGPPPERNVLELVGLVTGEWYELQISVTNSAGRTDAQYMFSASVPQSLEAMGESPKTMVNPVGDSSSLLVFLSYLDLAIVLPVALSLIVITIVLLVVCFVVRKKHSSDSSTYGTSPYEDRKGSDILGMTESEKGKSRDSNPYPQPYATTNLSSSSTTSGRRRRDENDSGYHQLQEEPLYATVKRTPRPPRTDGHIYHCPGLLLEPDQATPTSSDGAVVTKVIENDTDRKSSGSSKKPRDSKHLRNS